MLGAALGAAFGAAKAAGKSSFMKGTTSIGFGSAARNTGMGYLGKYSIGGGAVRAGAYFGASHTMGAVSDSISSGDIMSESSPAARAAAQLALGAGGIYAGFRGFKSATRGVVGSAQTLMPKGRQRNFGITGMRDASHRQKNALMNRERNISGTHMRSNQFSTPTTSALRSQQSSYANTLRDHQVPVFGSKDSAKYGGSLIGGMEKAFKLPGAALRKITDSRSNMHLAGRAAMAGPNLLRKGVHGAFGMGNVGLQTMRGFAGGTRNTIRGSGPGAFSSAATEGAVAFGAMSHPYAGVAMLGLGAGVTSSALSYNSARRKNLSMPTMKTGNSRPASNFGPNVTLMAHNRNRGM